MKENIFYIDKIIITGGSYTGMLETDILFYINDTPLYGETFYFSKLKNISQKELEEYEGKWAKGLVIIDYFGGVKKNVSENLGIQLIRGAGRYVFCGKIKKIEYATQDFKDEKIKYDIANLIVDFGDLELFTTLGPKIMRDFKEGDFICMEGRVIIKDLNFIKEKNKVFENNNEQNYLKLVNPKQARWPIEPLEFEASGKIISISKNTVIVKIGALEIEAKNSAKVKIGDYIKIIKDKENWQTVP